MCRKGRHSGKGEKGEREAEREGEKEEGENKYSLRPIAATET